MSSLIKYRVKELAADFGVAPKEIIEIVGKYYEKPKSNTQVLTEEELNVVFDYITQTNQIESLEVVFAAQAQPKQEEVPAEAPKAEEPKPQKPAEPENPKTGDETNLVLPVVLMVVSVMGIAAGAVCTKKFSYKGKHLK